MCLQLMHAGADHAGAQFDEKCSGFNHVYMYVWSKGSTDVLTCIPMFDHSTCCTSPPIENHICWPVSSN